MLRGNRATPAVWGIAVLKGPAAALARRREENAQQLRRRRRLEAVLRRGGLRPILELIEELIRHGAVAEAEIDWRLAAYAELDPAALRVTGGDRHRHCPFALSGTDKLARPSNADLRRGEAAAWGARPDPEPARSAPDRLRVRLISWKPVIKGSLRGFATVELPNGLRLIEWPVLVGSNGAWATLPSKPVLEREGKHVKPAGKPEFAPVVEWRSRELADCFSAAVVALIRAAHPDALDGGRSG